MNLTTFIFFKVIYFLYKYHLLFQIFIYRFLNKMLFKKKIMRTFLSKWDKKKMVKFQKLGFHILFNQITLYLNFIK